MKRCKANAEKNICKLQFFFFFLFNTIEGNGGVGGINKLLTNGSKGKASLIPFLSIPRSLSMLRSCINKINFPLLKFDKTLTGCQGRELVQRCAVDYGQEIVKQVDKKKSCPGETNERKTGYVKKNELNREGETRSVNKALSR